MGKDLGIPDDIREITLKRARAYRDIDREVQQDLPTTPDSARVTSDEFSRRVNQFSRRVRREGTRY